MRGEIPMPTDSESERYLRSCQSIFWQDVFRMETNYLLKHLKGIRDILSVGCGPAIIEGALQEHGFNLTGLDVSQEALDRAPDGMRSVVAKAEDMPFPPSSFDAVIFVASLQFIDDYQKALEKTTRVLRRNGLLIVMLLNPHSRFVKERLSNPHSYVSKMKHTNLKEIEEFIARDYSVHTEYFLGIDGGTVSDSEDIQTAALYIIKGKKKSEGIR
jgi:ubiquinone/menaquinone biosynthesis C-methylase UbiE